MGVLTKAQAAFLRKILDKGPFQPYASEWSTAYRLQDKGMVARDGNWNVHLTEAGRIALKSAS